MDENKLSYLEINIKTFDEISGCDQQQLLNNILVGDDWGMLLKVGCVIEAVCRRAIAKKLKLSLDNDTIEKMTYYNSLSLCRDLEIITKEGYDFANGLRLARNKLVHSAKYLGSDLKDLKEFQKSLTKLGNFVKIEGQDPSSCNKSYRNTLFFACISFISLIAKNVYNEDWFVSEE